MSTTGNFSTGLHLLQALKAAPSCNLTCAAKQSILGNSRIMDGPDSELSPKFAPFIGMVCLLFQTYIHHVSRGSLKT